MSNALEVRGGMLAQIGHAKAALAEVETIEDALRIAGFAESVRYAARQAEAGIRVQNAAAEVRLRAERRAGELLASMDTAQGARTDLGTSSNDEKKLDAIERAGIKVPTAYRYEQVARVPEPVFEEHLAAKVEAGEEITTSGLLTVARLGYHTSSATDQWETPPELYALLDTEFGFGLDVCALPENAKCERFFGPDDDGLAQEWAGVCWMNPPYGSEIAAWVGKAHAAAAAGATVVCLVPARTDTAWWWDHCRHGQVRFLRGRLKFGGGTMGAPFPSALVIFGLPASVIWWDKWPTG